VSQAALRGTEAFAAAAPSGVRFRILAWLCSLSALTYVDRICIMTVRENIEADLGLTPALTAYAFSAFSLAYALFEVPSGWLGDRIGPRKVLARIVLCWSTFTALTGAAWSLASLVFFRFLFGAGEAGAYPNIARASRSWFPFHERGLAQGLVWMFARWGGASGDGAGDGPCKERWLTGWAGCSSWPPWPPPPATSASLTRPCASPPS